MDFFFLGFLIQKQVLVSLTLLVKEFYLMFAQRISSTHTVAHQQHAHQKLVLLLFFNNNV